MDLNWQPALPETERDPASTAAAAAISPPASAPAPTPVKATGIRRIVATAALTVGLLAVGGVSAVMAASPAPSSSTAPSTTQPQHPFGAPNGTHNCPNMGSNGSGSGSGSGSSGSTSPSASG